MSQLTDLYESSTKPRPTAARLIPGQKTDYFDRQGDFSVGYTPELRRGIAGAEQFKTRGLQFYNEEVTSVVIPESFIPTLPDIPLHRYTPDVPFYTPGAPQS